MESDNGNNYGRNCANIFINHQFITNGKEFRNREQFRTMRTKPLVFDLPLHWDNVEYLICSTIDHSFTKLKVNSITFVNIPILIRGSNYDDRISTVLRRYCW